MYEPSDLDQAILDRLQLRVCPFGPLTLAELDSIESYERYMEEAALENEAEQAAGGRTICPQCGNRSVRHRSVVTLGYAGHPGAEYSNFASCEVCDYKEI